MKLYYFLVIISYFNVNKNIRDESHKESYYDVYHGKDMSVPIRRISINVVGDFGMNGNGKEDNSAKFKLLFDFAAKEVFKTKTR